MKKGRVFSLLFLISSIFVFASCKSKSSYEKIDEIKPEYKTDYVLISNKGITNYNNSMQINYSSTYELANMFLYKDYMSEKIFDENGNPKELTYSCDDSNVYVTAKNYDASGNTTNIFTLTYDFVESIANVKDWYIGSQDLDLYSLGQTDIQYIYFKDIVEAHKKTIYRDQIINSGSNIPKIEDVLEKSDSAGKVLKAFNNKIAFSNQYLYINNNDKYVVLKTEELNPDKIYNKLDMQFVFKYDEVNDDYLYIGYSIGDVISIVPIIHQF